MPSLVWAKGPAVGAATEEQKEAAKAPYIEGRTAFDEARFGDALRLFQASYDIVSSPNSHHMMAMAMRELGQLAQAYEHFGEVAVEADEAAVSDEKYKKAAENARAKRQELMAQIGFVLLQVGDAESTESITIGGRPIERSRWTGPIPVTPGNNEVVATMRSGTPTTETLTVVAGQTHELRIGTAPVAAVVPPPVESSGGIKWVTPYRITAYAVAGAGLVSLAVAAGLGSAAQSKHDELATTCGAGPCPLFEDDIAAGESLQVATNVMVVVGAVLVAGGAALWWFAPDAHDDEGPATGSMYVAPLPGGVMLGGTF